MKRAILNLVLMILICVAFVVGCAPMVGCGEYSTKPGAMAAAGFDWIILQAITIMDSIGVIILSSVSLNMVKKKSDRSKSSVRALMSASYVIIAFEELVYLSALRNEEAKGDMSFYFTLVVCIFVAVATIITMFNTYGKKMYEKKT